jgi:hypothetical protein
MKKFSWILAIALPVAFVACQKAAVQEESTQAEANLVSARVGNGAPSGSHYNLNIIGVENTKTFNYDEYEQSNTQGKGRRIFVPLNGNAKILLSKGDFAVLDANGTDGTAAFRLPEPDATDDGITDYSVYIRGLGKQGGSASMKSCMVEPEGSDIDGDGVTGETYCSTGEYIVNLTAHGGNNKFQNVTNQLLYVWADLDLDGDLDRTELFDTDFETFYWDYQNSGLRLAQMRFYPQGTEVWADPEPTN